jgi:hypothetical protein
MNKSTFLARVAHSRPDALLNYTYDDIPGTFGSTSKLPIRCKLHGVFYQKPHVHLYGGGCRRCGLKRSAELRTLGVGGFIINSRSKFGDKFTYDKTVYVGQNTELVIGCPRHGDIMLTPREHYQYQYGCRECGLEIPRELEKKRYIDLATHVHDGKYGYGNVVYVNSTDKVEINCPLHGPFWQGLYAHTKRANACPTCTREADRLSQDQFIRQAQVTHGGRYLYDKTQYATAASMVTITCPRHGDWIQRAGSHLQGNGCAECHRESKLLPLDEFIEKAKAIHGDNYDYSKVDYQGNKTPVEIICPVHGSFWQRPNTHISAKNGCQLCQESVGERAVEVFLKKHGIRYIREHRIVPHRYRFDFYLPDLDIYIEFNGKQHYTPVELFGGEAAYLATKERDRCKRVLVKQHGGRLVVLTHVNLKDGVIENVLVQRLKSIFAFWCAVDGTLEVFKSVGEVYRRFEIPDTIAYRNLVEAVLSRHSNVKILF